jgi:hypothetical protein
MEAPQYVDTCPWKQGHVIKPRGGRTAPKLSYALKRTTILEAPTMGDAPGFRQNKGRLKTH